MQHCPPLSRCLLQCQGCTIWGTRLSLAGSYLQKTDRPDQRVNLLIRAGADCCSDLANRPPVVQVAKIPTFQVIILQGILGSTPWNALVYLTLYLQLIGFRDSQAALAVACFQAGAALGGVVGGLVGDWAAKRSHNHGRIFACQFSVFMGIPFSLLLMKGLPQNGEPLTVALYVVTLFTFGLLHVWAAPACNNPVFAEIVPAELRNLVYAFDRCAPVTPHSHHCVHCACCGCHVSTHVARWLRGCSVMHAASHCPHDGAV
jgi:hypothetical protein